MITVPFAVPFLCLGIPVFTEYHCHTFLGRFSKKPCSIRSYFAIWVFAKKRKQGRGSTIPSFIFFYISFIFKVFLLSKCGTVPFHYIISYQNLFFNILFEIIKWFKENILYMLRLINMHTWAGYMHQTRLLQYSKRYYYGYCWWCLYK
jgi:hypothetical protein